MMYAEAPDIPAGKILDISLKRLHSLRRSVFKDIIAKAHEVPNLIVNTHATFRWRHGLFPAVDFDQMRRLNTDVYICLIDGVTTMHQRLLEHLNVEHTLKDLIVWREEEIISTEMLCKGINETVPFYSLARGVGEDTAETFYRLAFEPEVKKAYLSFPMTAVAEVESVLAEIARFRTQMKQHFACFDPGDLEEAYLPLKAQNAKEAGLDYIDVTAGNRRIRLDADEVCQIERDINSQIYARDFLLIDQADMIGQLHPVHARRPGGHLQRRRTRTPARPRSGQGGLRHLDRPAASFGLRHPDRQYRLPQHRRSAGLLRRPLPSLNH